MRVLLLRPVCPQVLQFPFLHRGQPRTRCIVPTPTARTLRPRDRVALPCARVTALLPLPLARGALGPLPRSSMCVPRTALHHSHLRPRAHRPLRSRHNPARRPSGSIAPSRRR